MFFKNGALVEQSLVTATSGGTLTLTNVSPTYQIFTGSSNHTLKLPDATTMRNGRRFEVLNSSTGVITIQDDGSNTITTLEAGTSKIFRLMDNGTANGTYDITVAGTGGGISTAEAGQIAAAGAKSYSETSRVLKFNPEEMGGNFWRSRSPVSVAKCWPTNWNQNGFIYNAFGVDNSSTQTATNERYDIDANYFLSRATGITVGNTRAPFVLENLGYAINGDPSINAVERYSDVTNAWSSRTAIGTAYYGLATFVLNGYGYVANGTGGGATLTSLYDPTANAWYSRVAATSANRVGQGSAEYNGFGYSVSGTSTAAVRRYNPELHSWGTVASSTVGHGMGGVNASVGALVVSGGENTGGTTTTTVERFFDTTGAWQTMASNSQARYGCGAQHAGVFMHISNGIGTGVAYTTVESFQQSSLFNLGTLKRVMTTPTSISVQALLNAISVNAPVQVRTDGDNWVSFESGGTPLKYGEVLSTKFQPTGLIYASGGDTGSGSNLNTFHNEEANTWTAKTVLLVNRWVSAGFSLDGLAYAAGGSGDLTSIEAFNDITNLNVSKSALLSLGRSCNGASLNGFGYAIGGQNGAVTVDNVDKYNPTADSFTTAAVISVARNAPVTYELAGRIYAATGATGNGSSGNDTGTHERYDDALDTWTTMAATTSKAYAGGYSISGFGYVAQGAPGLGTSTAFRYDPSANSWASVASSNFSSLNSTGSQSREFGWLLGGYNGSYLTNVDRYNPYSNTYSARAVLPVARASMLASNFTPGSYRNYEVRIGIPAFYAGLGANVWSSKTSLTGIKEQSAGAEIGRVFYLFGGFNGSYINHAERYSPEKNEWLRIENLGSIRTSPFAFALNGKVWIGSGANSNTPTYSNSSEAFDPITLSYASFAAISATNWDQGAGTAFNGYGYRLQGRQNGSSAGIADCEQYNQSTNAWTTKASVSQARYNNVGMVNDNEMFSMGGINSGTNYANVDKYNDAANTWSAMTAMGSLRRGAVGGIVGGQIHMAGGFNGSYLNSVEAYNQYSNIWSTKVNKPTAVAFLNPNGRFNGGLLSAGGANGGGDIATVEFLNDSVKQAVLSAGLTVK